MSNALNLKDNILAQPSFGAKLKTTRESVGMSQIELAKLIHRAPFYINTIERPGSTVVPPWKTLGSIAEALGVPFETFLKN